MVARKAGELGREDLLEKLVNDKDYSVRMAVAEKSNKTWKRRST